MAKNDKVLVGAQVRVEVADRLTDLARRNDRSVAAELRIAIANHLSWAEGSEFAKRAGTAA